MKLSTTVRHIQDGAPQGSPLAPLLSIICTADIQKPTSPTAHLSIYTDDPAIVESSKSLKSLITKLKKAYKTTPNCLKKWKIKINDTKTQLIYIFRKREKPTHPLTIDKQRIEWKTKVKYLNLTAS